MPTPSPNDQLSALLDGELSDAEATALEEALRTDASLRSDLERLKQVQRLLRSHGPARAPEGFADRVRQRVQIEEAQRTTPWWRRPMGIPLEGVLIAAAAVLVLIVAVPNGPTSTQSGAVQPTEGADERAARPVDPPGTKTATEKELIQGDEAPQVAKADPPAEAPLKGAQWDEGIADANPVEKDAVKKQPVQDSKSQASTDDDPITAIADAGTDEEGGAGLQKAPTKNEKFVNAGYNYTIYAEDSDILLALQRVAGRYSSQVLDPLGQPMNSATLTQSETTLLIDVPADQASAFIRELKGLGVKVLSDESNDMIAGSSMRIQVTLMLMGGGEAQDQPIQKRSGEATKSDH